MKKVILFICLLLISISVEAKNPYEITKTTRNSYNLLFTICDRDDTNCVNIDEITINDNEEYDNFTLRDGIIYLNNADISMGIYSDNVYINVTGTNKIKRFVNTTNNGISEGERYIPFNIIGDGTLEIENYDKYNKNDIGEISYFYWGTSGRSVTLLTRLVQLNRISESNIIVSVPKEGWTLSDLVDIIYAEESGSNIYISNGKYSDDIINTTIEERDLPKESRLKELIDKGYDKDKEQIKEYFKAEIGLNIDAIDPVTNTTKVDMEWKEASIRTSLPVSLTKSGTIFIGEKPIEYVKTIQTDGIILEAKEGINSNYSLKIEDIIKDVTSEINESIKEKTKKTLLSLYEINILDEDNEIINASDGIYKIRIKSDELIKKYENFAVIYIDNDNNIEELETTINDDYIEFSTTHLSKYGIIGTAIKMQSTENKPIDTQKDKPIVNPKTIDYIYVNVICFIALSFVMIIALLKLKKIRKLS